jgi:hypothetical protein
MEKLDSIPDDEIEYFREIIHGDIFQLEESCIKHLFYIPNQTEVRVVYVEYIESTHMFDTFTFDFNKHVKTSKKVHIRSAVISEEEFIKWKSGEIITPKGFEYSPDFLDLYKLL